MKRKLLALSVLALAAGSTKAQTLTTDAGWCQTLEKILADNGISATANCDRDGDNKIVHLTIGNQTQRYRVVSGDKTDYSTTILIAIEGMEYGPQWGHNNRHLEARDWHYRSGLSSNWPDEVWEDARDLAYVEEALHRAVNRCTRTSEVQPQYIDQNIQEGNTVLSLRCRILDLQRGEQYEKGGNAPAPAGNVRGERRDRPKVSKRMAYGCVSVQLVNTLTGEVIMNQTYDKGDYVYATSTTDPMDNVVSSISSDLSSWLNRRFTYTAPRPAVNGTVLKGEEVNEKKGKVETLYIDCGTAQELRNGDEFTVYRVHNIGGNVGSTPIGKIKVKEIQGPNLSLCKVSKGDKEIYAALTAGETLAVR